MQSTEQCFSKKRATAAFKIQVKRENVKQVTVSLSQVDRLSGGFLQVLVLFL